MGIEPTDAEVIKGGIRAALAEVFTATVGLVNSYDPLTQTAEIKPVMKRAYNIGQNVSDFEELPIIYNVPVRQARAGKFFFHMPVAAGDHVLLIFTHDDIANWRETGDAAEPDDLRRHSLGSCVALVGMADQLSPLSPNPLDLAARAAGLYFGDDGGPRTVLFTEDGWIQIGGTSPAPIVPPLLSPIALGIGTQTQITALEMQVATLQVEIGVMATAIAALTAMAAAAVPVTGYIESGTLKATAGTAGGAVVGAVVAGAASVAAGTALVTAVAPTAQSTMVRSV